MKRKSTLVNLIIIAAVFLIAYALFESLNQYNTLAMFLSLGSLGALCVCIYLFAQLRRSNDEEEQGSY